MGSEVSMPAAIVFDMDGVLVDSNPFHLKKWVELLNERRIPFNEESLPKQILGARNDTAFRLFFGNHLTDQDILQLSEELEGKFRKVFAPHAKPLAGLSRLMEECQANAVPMAVASSAISKNVEFIVDALKLRPYLRSIVNGDEVAHPKPHPEIYLKTAHKLGVKPFTCVAFEDSFVGVEAAKRAGMKCVAIASTFPAEELRSQTHADLISRDFRAVTLDTLRGLFAADTMGESSYETTVKR
jgi:beta-phosphoglucomutase